ncbi:MAG TPA: NADH-quinone oxidoreductase subunit NuoH [Methylomirabilota bacterium]|jgi:NADH-quinone oxidoreductase subunit H|nr:NADH-quinone oxidoreductase subunit NuoH [Methylomirabilota bacterium]
MRTLLWTVGPPFFLLNGVLLLVTYLTLVERKVAARLQSRVGPYEVGRPHGWLQPIADAIKLLLKEDIVPASADRVVYNLAPIVFLVPAFLMYAAIPFARGWALADLDIGVLFVLAVSSLEVIGLFMCGWGSNNKYALLSAMRAVNQIISYEVPFILIALVPVVLTGSLRLTAIVDAQRGWFGWFVFYPGLGQVAFLAFLVFALASENRIPFDIVEAESELVAGFRVEYSGMKFALVQLAEFVHLFGIACLATLLFLGGWLGPWAGAVGPLWFVLKALAVFLVIVWVRWSFIRIRVDQILALSWRLFLPAAVVLLLAAGAVVAAWGGGRA